MSANEPATTPKTICDCLSWARNGNDFIWSHHPDCRHHKPADDMRALVGRLCDGITWWASQGDGVPEELYESYYEAMMRIGRPIKYQASGF